MDDSELIQAARDVQAAAYVPYSEYTVGAAILTDDGEVYAGCNLEVSNYSNSLHAEEVAIAEAVKAGHEAFSTVAVSSGERDAVTPCGMCRQTLSEFCDDDLRVLCDAGDDGVREHRLGDLLPDTIGPETLGK